MNLHLTITQTLRLIDIFLVIYLVVDSLEKLYCFKEYQPNGILSWDILVDNSFFTSRPAFFRKILNIVFPTRTWLAILVLRALCAVALLVFFPFSVASIICYCILFIIGAFANLRNIAYGAETENRFSLIIIGALLLRSLVPTQTVTIVSLWFIALQVCLTYVTAGISKLRSVDWLAGNGFRLVFTSSREVPLKGVNIFFKERKAVSMLLNWLIIIFECLFPLILLVPRQLFWCFLVAGIIFHLAIAIWLRLGNFFWIWVATYPALIFITQR
jgi:hypothetical protein